MSNTIKGIEKWDRKRAHGTEFDNLRLGMVINLRHFELAYVKACKTSNFVCACVYLFSFALVRN